jgi:hypothetical protein
VAPGFRGLPPRFRGLRKKLFDSIGQSFSFGGKLQPGGFCSTFAQEAN